MMAVGRYGRCSRRSARFPSSSSGAADPVADGFVQSLAHPGGNMTGFTVLGSRAWEQSCWGCSRRSRPRVPGSRSLVNPDNLSGGATLSDAARRLAAQKFAVRSVAAPVREHAEIEAVMTRLEREPDCGLIVPPDPSINTDRRLIIELAAQYRLPTIYALRAATAEGGLMSYGVDIPDLFRKAAGYADRILRGEKPADLPVELPTKFELVINLKTAKALGLPVPDNLLATADEVIE